MIYLTRQEQRIVIFLVVVMLLGTGLLLIKRFQPGWAMRLSLGEPDFDVAEDEISPRLKSDGSEQKAEPKQDQQANQPLQNNGTETASKPPQKEKININTATIEELEILPGIGPVLAQRVIDYRQKFGGFKNIRELTGVDGIGNATLQKFKDRITVKEHSASE